MFLPVRWMQSSISVFLYPGGTNHLCRTSIHSEINSGNCLWCKCWETLARAKEKANVTQLRWVFVLIGASPCIKEDLTSELMNEWMNVVLVSHDNAESKIHLHSHFKFSLTYFRLKPNVSQTLRQHSCPVFIWCSWCTRNFSSDSEWFWFSVRAAAELH